MFGTKFEIILRTCYNVYVRVVNIIKSTNDNKVLSMSNILIKKSTKFSITEQKIFYMCLYCISKGMIKDDEVFIEKKEFINKLGLSNSHAYTDIRNSFKNIIKNSYIQFTDGDNFNDGVLICNVKTNKKYFIVKFNREYLPLIKDLSKNYTRLLNDDVISFSSKHSMMLYQNLMRLSLYCKCIKLTTKQIKDFTGIDEKGYCRKNGKFDRHSFELNVIRKSVDEINEKSNCINNLEYSKEYDGRKVKCYSFSFEYVDPNSIGKENNYINNDENKTDKNFSDEVKNYVWW